MITFGTCIIRDSIIFHVDDDFCKIVQDTDSNLLQLPIENIINLDRLQSARKVRKEAIPIVNSKKETFLVDIEQIYNKELNFTILHIWRTKDRIFEDKKYTNRLKNFSAGIAHHFNNLLTILINQIEVEFNFEHSDKVNTTLSKIQEIIQNFKIYAERIDMNIVNVNVNTVITAMIEDYKIELPSNIDFTYSVNDNIIFSTDLDYFKLIFKILVDNAIESVSNEGTIHVEIDRKYLRSTDSYEGRIFTNSPIKSRNYVQIRVCDNGSGIDEQSFERIFDPFYTSKTNHLGMGLSILQGYVFYHEGFIELRSNPSEGTCFNVYIPMTTKHTIPNIQSSEKVIVQTQKKTIMVVDDQEAIRNVQRLMLSRIGYEVLEASNGQECLDMYNKMDQAVDLIILDMSMPVLNGEETCKQLLKINPFQSIIISSGFSMEDVNTCANKTNIHLLPKPYSSKSFLELVNKLLS
ncbi:MAG: response regulator [Candidatus Heimdallarchaeota archaeon]|nr:response regulator [Candidatus Heimdallarchaeota archaeon]